MASFIDPRYESMVNEEESSSEISLRDYLRVLFRHKWIVLLSFMIVMTTVYVGLKMKTPVYVAKVKMLITAEKEVSSPYYRELYGGRNLQLTLTQSEIVKSNTVIEKVVNALQLHKIPVDYEKRFASEIKARWITFNSRRHENMLNRLTGEQRDQYLFRVASDRLRSQISVEPVRDTNMFTISVKDFNPTGAFVLANVVSRAYVMFDLEQQLAELLLKYGRQHPKIQLLENHINEMGRTLDGQPLDSLEAIGPASVKIIEQASYPLRPTGPAKKMTFLLAALMAFFFSVILAFIFEYLDPTFRTPNDLERYLDVPYLGFITKKKLRDKVLLKDSKRESLYTHTYQNVADQLHLLIKDRGLKTILMSSTMRKEGASTVILNVATYMAYRLHHKVLVIEANLRRPNFAKLLKLKDNAGLVSILEGKNELEDVVQPYGGYLRVVTAGDTLFNPVTLLDSHRMADLLRKAREEYEVILIDCANIQTYKDAAILSKNSDGVVVVVDEGRTRRQIVKRAVSQLKGSKVNILGIILNQRKFYIPKMIYDRT